MSIPEHDVICIGAGFGTITTMARLRKLGLDVKALEKGSELGGIWYWNCYPGARVDSDAPIYQLFDKEIYSGFTFKERYPGRQELRRYFTYLDEKLKLSKDIKFNTAVKGAAFDEERGQWDVECENGEHYRCRWLIPAIGFAAKKYVPPFPGIEKFKGIVEHTATWPQGGVEMKGKRIAVIGTGASGVQTTQESGRDAEQLTVYQRTPNCALPMNQRDLNEKDHIKMKEDGTYEETFELCHETFGGFQFDFQPQKAMDDSPEERKALFQKLLVEEGGFRFWLNTYHDLYHDEKANLEAYHFWRDWVHTRVKDPEKAEILAPAHPHHPFGTKRPSLEQYYYEIFNLPQVDLVDLSINPITEFTETGILTDDGKHREFDVIALATGFDSVTGSLAQLDIRGIGGQTIAEHWADGLRSCVGIALNGFPNLFFLYGPQAPTAFSNGPSCVQFQAEWLERLFPQIIEKKIVRMEATADSEVAWTKRLHHVWDNSLWPRAKSWYQGANIPGRRVEPLNWSGGMVPYIQALDETTKNDFQSWIIKTAS